MRVGRRTLAALVAITATINWGTVVLADDIGAYATTDGNTATATAMTPETPHGTTQPAQAASSGPPLRCDYTVRIPVLSVPITSPIVGETYRLICRDPAGAVVVDEDIIYNPGVPPQVLTDTARQRAEAQLDPPEPSVATNPPSGAQTVGVPTWFWIEGPWEPRSATATVGPVSSTVTATPRDVRWDLGDGQSITCAGPGVRYDTTRAPDEQSSSCQHVYTHRSTGSDASAGYQVTATVTYDVTWTSTTGQGGSLGTLSRSSTVTLVVQEIQAVIR